MHVPSMWIGGLGFIGSAHRLKNYIIVETLHPVKVKYFFSYIAVNKSLLFNGHKRKKNRPQPMSEELSNQFIDSIIKIN